ncbi:MAG: DUF1839 family protein [Chloroflexi bacterium]|nr:DUF1839 family protein [Chloroflexota bacterium]
MALITTHAGLEPADYQPHRLHADSGYAWPEQNCYFDLWIELLHSLGCDPVPCFYPGLTTTYVSDQWQFIKPDPSALLALYGVRLYEINVWEPVATHVARHVADGNPVLLEVDAYDLPDVAGLSYQIKHSKTTIGIVGIDSAAEELWYLHNRGLYSLAGVDYRAALQLDQADRLPFFIEAASLKSLVRRDAGELRAISLRLLGSSLEQLGAYNPFPAFRAHLGVVLPRIAAGEIEVHGYAFASLRQLGAACSLGAEYLAWCGLPRVEQAVEELGHVSQLAQAFILRLARAAARGRVVDVDEPLGAMEVCWMRAMSDVRERLASEILTNAPPLAV